MKTVFLRRGVADVSIVIPRNPAIVEKTAAEELTDYLKKSLDVTLPTVTEGEESGKCIYVGKTDYALQASVVGTAKEHWLIHMHEGNLILTGGKKIGERGIIYATYHFLEDIVGVRWWDAYTEDVPSLDELALEDDFHKEGIPVFRFRRPYMDSRPGIEYFKNVPRTRSNMISAWDDRVPEGAHHPDVRKYGDVIHVGRPHQVHVLRDYFPENEYYEKHPEWFAYNRTRDCHLKTGHFCFSNEEFKRELKKRLYAYIEEDIVLSRETGVEIPYFYSLGLDDKSDREVFCQCEKCAKIIEESGYSGYNIRFVNELAREVAVKYPGIKLETTAYVCFIEPPKDDTVPESNVIIRIAANSCDILRGIHSPSNRSYLRRLKAWVKTCSVKGAEIHVWQYMNSGQLNYPLPIFHGLPDLVRTLHEHGVTGMFTETQCGHADCWELNKFMISHLLENPYLDEEALVADFCSRFYGKKAGPYVKEYLDAICRATERNPAQVYVSREDCHLNYIDSTAVVEGARALDLADAALGDEEPYRTRFNWLRKPMDGIILTKYYDLKHQAAERGEEFNFDRAVLKARVTAALQARLADPRFGTPSPTQVFLDMSSRTRYLEEIDYFTNLRDEELAFPIPECLADADPKDIYQLAFGDMWRWIAKWVCKWFGGEVVADEKASTPTVLKFNIDKTTYKPMTITMRPSSKDAKYPYPLPFRLMQEDQVVAERKFFKEDLPKGGYEIYKVGSISDISQHHNSSFYPSCEEGIFFINLSGLSSTFPMDACDVYLSFRTTGEAYGGSPEDENAVYFERLIVHRTKR